MNDVRTANKHSFEVFYDGGCPLCRREMNWLEKKDAGNQVLFTNIHDPDFEEPLVGKSVDELMGQIHGRTPDGNWVTGVEVFRIIYRAIGFRLPVTISRWPLIRTLLDLSYGIFAKYRLRLTGRRVERGCRQT